jgi:uncharacterized delta-60 repeat protein
MDAKKLGILVLIVAFSAIVFAEGNLDQTFGTGGKVITDFYQRIDAASIALQSDGKMVVAGNNSNGYPVFVRYNMDGSADMTFGTNGVVMIQSMAISNSLAIQADSKILIAGTITLQGPGTRIIAVTRLNQDGSVDTDFGNNGNGTVTTIINGDDRPLDLALQQNGKIVVTGITQNDVFVARYLTDGSLDTSFDGDGIVVRAFSGASSTSRGLAIDPNGNIIVAGAHLDGGIRNLLVLRFKSTGAPDLTFGGGNGYVITDVLDDERVRSVALQADGKIVVAGEGDHGSGTDTDFVVVRYDTAGNLDPTFDGNGKKAEVEPGDQVLSKIVIRPDGRIAYTGTTTDSNGVRTLRAYCYNSDGSIFYNFALNGGTGTPDTGKGLIVQTDNKVVIASTDDHDLLMRDLGAVRLTSTGTMDSTFGNSGTVTTLIPGAVDSLVDAGLQSDGKIVTLSATNKDLQLVRYNSDGTIDTSFGVAGRVIDDFLGGDDEPAALAIMDDGKIVVAGSVDYPGEGQYISIAKYNQDGSPDPSFGNNGKLVTNVSSVYERVNDVTVDSDGKILVAGTTFSAFDYDFLALRYNSTGVLDPTFGAFGILITDISPGSNDFVYGLTIQPDGKILLAGRTCEIFCDFAIARFLPNGGTDNSFGLGGITVTSLLDYDFGYAVALQPNGKIIVGGYGYNATGGSSILLARYDTNGFLDSSFGDLGRVNTLLPDGSTAANMFLHTNGRILVTGNIPEDSFLAEFNNNGSLRTEFGMNGILTTDFGNSDVGKVILGQNDGKIIVGGTSYGAPLYNYDITLARYSLSIFFDDFEDGVADWQFLKPSWNETGGNLVGTPSRKAIAIAPSTFTGCAANCMVESNVQSAGGSGSKISLLTWYQDKNNYVEVLIQEQKVILKQRINKKVVAKAKGLIQIVPNQSYLVKITFDGNAFQVFVDGNLLITLNKAAGTSPSGTVGFQVKGTVGTFSEILVDSL